MPATAVEPAVTPDLVAQHGLAPEEYARIQQILGREPTFTELGIFSVMWSEHCSYKSSKVHLRTLPTEGARILQGPGENAGIVDVGDGLAVVFKLESHNHPSFIEPYQGAATGVGGIIRDIFTMGARPIALFDSLRFGPLTETQNRYLMGGVVAGIAGYGNAVGVPTVGGEVVVADCYRHNPLVNVLCVGLAEASRLFFGRAGGVGNPVIYVGARTGRDGIHGATMASESFDETSAERRPTVQVGDPFKEKLLIEACLELMATDALVGIQDMGAAGLTCSSCEMASRGGVGVELELDAVPRREAGMTPYELMLSESQERMLLVVRQGSEERVRAIFRKWDLDAAVIGRVTDDQRLRVRDGGRVVADIPARALAEEGPVYRRPMARPKDLDALWALDLSRLPAPGDCTAVLHRLLASPTIASKEVVWRRYDHMLHLNTVVPPGGDAAVLRLKGTGRALAVSTDGNGRYCALDPYLGGQIAVAEAARNVTCAGAEPVAITNCLNFGNPEVPEVMWQFAEVVRGMGAACRALGTPVTGGNVSFYNETLGVSIAPTPVVGMLGILEHIGWATAPWWTTEGDLLLLLGESKPELGATEYLKAWHDLERGRPPAIDLERERRVQAACRAAIQRGLVRAAHDCSDGGLAVALAEMAIGGPGVPLGAAVTLERSMRADALLFGETQSRILLAIPPSAVPGVLEAARTHGAPARLVGRVGGDRLVIRDPRGTRLVEAAVTELAATWRGALPTLLRVERTGQGEG